MFRLQPRQRRQLEAHIWAYAEMLLAWCLPQKRAELLESARAEFDLGPLHPVIASLLNSSPLGKLLMHIDQRMLTYHVGVVRPCPNCGQDVKESQEFCSCGTRKTAPRCTICRLPIKGM